MPDFGLFELFIITMAIGYTGAFLLLAGEIFIDLIKWYKKKR